MSHMIHKVWIQVGRDKKGSTTTTIAYGLCFEVLHWAKGKVGDIISTCKCVDIIPTFSLVIYSTPS